MQYCHSKLHYVLLSCKACHQLYSIFHFYILLLFSFQLYHRYLRRWKHCYQMKQLHNQRVLNTIFVNNKCWHKLWTFYWTDSQPQLANFLFPKKTTQQYFQVCWNCVRQRKDFLYMLKVLHKRDFYAFNTETTIQCNPPRYAASDSKKCNYCHSITNLPW